MRRVLLLTSLMASGALGATPLPTELAEQTGDALVETPETELEVEAELKANTPLEVKVGHAFSRAEARERVGYLMEYWNRRFGIKAAWNGYRVFLSGRVWGIKVQAAFDVGETEVVALSVDPGRLLRGRASSYVERKLKKYLNVNYDEPS